MKPNLILGLGNPLMGDDGVGWRVAELLSKDARLPPESEAICAGADLLRWADQMEGRRRVILVDALLGDGPLGWVEAFEEPFPELDPRQWNAHHLSPTQAVRLLQAALPTLQSVHFTLLGVTIESVEARPGLSAELNARLPEILDYLLRNIA